MKSAVIFLAALAGLGLAAPSTQTKRQGGIGSYPSLDTSGNAGAGAGNQGGNLGHNSGGSTDPQGHNGGQYGNPSQGQNVGSSGGPTSGNCRGAGGKAGGSCNRRTN